MSIFHRKKPAFRPDEDPTGISRAVIDFNGHRGPAKIFYNRNSKAFFTNCSEPGEDAWWCEDMANGLDVVEVYRKTSAMPDVKVTPEALRLMEAEIPPFSVW